MQTEKSQPEGKGIIPETRFTEFPVLSVDPRVEISRSASETDDCLFFLPMTLKMMIHHSTFLLFLTVGPIRRITTFPERHSVFFVVPHKSFDVVFTSSVSCL